MADLVHRFDWASTSLGPMEAWPPGLRAVVDLMLASAQPAYIGWGPALLSLYNDACVPILGGKHPDRLGKPFRDTWPEIWSEFEPLVAEVMAGRSRYAIDQPVALAGRPDRPVSWFTYSWTPIRLEDGAVGGFYCVATETTERVLAERALRTNYRALSDAIDEGFCIIEMLHDDEGRAVDYRFLEMNPVFEQQAGFSIAPGQRISEIAPDLDRFFFDTYGGVAATGEPARFEHWSDALGVYYDVYAFRVDAPGQRHVAVLFRDITERKQAEAALRDSESRQAFLLALSDALRPLADPVQVRDTACRMLGRHLGAHRVAYAEHVAGERAFEILRNYVDGVAEITGRFPYEAYGADIVEGLQAGRPRVQPDIQADPGLTAAQRRALAEADIGASLNVPLVKEGALIAFLGVNFRGPHRFTDAEVQLVRDVAERTWAAVERARAEAALRESEARMTAAFESVPAGIAVFGMDGKVVLCNEHYRRFVPNGVIPSRDPPEGDRWEGWDADGRPLPRHLWPSARALRGDTVVPGQEMRYTNHGGQQVWTNVATAPVLDGSGRITACISVISDITERKLAEAALRESDTKFRSVFEAMSEACCLFDMIYDDAGNPVDWRIVEANAGYERQSGLKDVGGRLASEFMPGTERYWIETFDRVVKSGEPEQIENWHQPTGRWVHSSTARVGGPGSTRLVSVFYDVTARKRAEHALRVSEERQRFLLALSDAFRAQPDEAAIGTTAVTALARHMGLDRCYIAEMSDALDRAVVGPEWHRAEMPPVAGEHAYARYPDIVARFRSGKPLVSSHVDRDPGLSALDKASLAEGLGLQAVLSAFLHRGHGETIWSITVGCRAPRDWSEDELRLLQDVTERTWAAIALARAGVGLREREADLARVQRIGGVGGLDIDVAHAMTSRRSPEYLRLHGLPGDWRTETHADWRARVHPDDVDSAERALFQALDGTSTTFESEYRIIRPSDGEVRWIHARADVERDAAGKALRLVGAHVDVTEQKDMQAEVVEGAERLRALFESMDESFYLVEVERDGDGRATGVRRLQDNTASPDDHGTRPAHAARSTAIARFDASWLAIVDRVARSGQAERFTRFTPSTGRWHDFHVFATSGGKHHVGVLASDITESKRAESALRAAESRIRTLIEGIPQLVWRARDAGHWTWARPQWTAFTGQAEPDSHGWGWLEVLHPDDRSAARDAWLHADRSGGFEVEYRILDVASGAYRWFQTRATPVRDDNGAVIEWLGSSTDIDDLRELQEGQRVLVGELQHRTRNLMGVIHAMTDRIASDSRDLPDFRARFQDRMEALARVQALLSRLGETDRLTFDELLRAELRAMDGDADRVGLTGPGGVRLRSSTVQALAMALHELATNAVKYGALGQPQARLDIAWTLLPPDPRGRTWLRIDWREQGVCMPATTAPPRRGQGRQLIEDALAYQLGARTTIDLGEDGLHCTIELPVSRQHATTGA